MSAPNQCVPAKNAPRRRPRVSKPDVQTRKCSEWREWVGAPTACSGWANGDVPGNLSLVRDCDCFGTALGFAVEYGFDVVPVGIE